MALAGMMVMLAGSHVSLFLFMMPEIHRTIATTVQTLTSGVDDLGKRTSALENADDTSRLVLTGTVYLSEREMPELSDPNPRNDAGKRGKLNGRVTFAERFANPPEVLIALSTMDFDADVNQRLSVTLEGAPDVSGFSYEFITWADTKVWWARANWIAIGDRRDSSYPEPDDDG